MLVVPPTWTAPTDYRSPDNTATMKARTQGCRPEIRRLEPTEEAETRLCHWHMTRWLHACRQRGTENRCFPGRCCNTKTSDQLRTLTESNRRSRAHRTLASRYQWRLQTLRYAWRVRPGQVGDCPVATGVRVALLGCQNSRNDNAQGRTDVRHRPHSDHAHFPGSTGTPLPRPPTGSCHVGSWYPRDHNCKDGGRRCIVDLAKAPRDRRR